MPMITRVTCPNCKNQFQTPVEQVFDIQANPEAKMQVLNGLVNLAVCPHCQMAGPLNLPFLYHDAEKELALVYMPMEAGRDDLERQQAIGKLTSTVIEDLPPEERKGYLLQPQVFLTLENLTNKILEADGITPEMIEAQKAKHRLLERMLEATSEEALEAMIKENDEVINSELFNMLNANMQMAQATGQTERFQQLANLHNKLLELSTEGRAAKGRGETLQALQEEPTRDKLLELLTQATDEQMRELLITIGRELLDYVFFQSLTSQIDSASDEEEKARLQALRTEILEIRDRVDKRIEARFAERSALLQELLQSDDPEALIRQRAREIDQVFLDTLALNLKEAQSRGDENAVQALQAIWALVFRLMEESLPPRMRLLNRLMRIEGEAEVESMLQENRALVTEQLIQLIQEVQSREDIPKITEERLALILKKTKEMLA